MKPTGIRKGLCALAFSGLTALALPAWAEPKHGIAMYGEPALPPDFVSLPYANPDAPQGGRIVFGESRGEDDRFDSLNPYIRKGIAPYGLRVHSVESLLGRNRDEPFALYGLLAESVEVPDDRSWVEFTLREEARFSDGSPVTVEDVIWSFETLGTVGHPRYVGAWSKVEKIEETGPRTVRMTFNTADRELPLIMGLRPILKKAPFDGREFAETPDILPIASGPYVATSYEMGRYINFEKNPDYWGEDLPFNAGLHNLDEIRYDFYGDDNIVFEAFKAGDVDTYRETSATKWDSNYDFPRLSNGEVVKSVIPHGRPSGLTGLVMNTRKPMFEDWRVREAMIQAFNYEFISDKLNGGVDQRPKSYFDNSELGMSTGPADADVKALLEQFPAELLPGALEGYEFPVSNGSEANRAGIRKALELMEEAGWTVQDGVMKNAQAEPFTFEIVLRQGLSEQQSIADIFVENMARLGITPVVTIVDSAQYRERINAYDFDMTWLSRVVSLSPGNELNLYFGSKGVTEPNSRNWMGVNSPAVDQMIDNLLQSTSHQEFVSVTKALDRLLTSGRYIIPVWYSRESRLAHSSKLHFPERLPIYGDWPGFQPDVWWYEE